MKIVITLIALFSLSFYFLTNDINKQTVQYLIDDLINTNNNVNLLIGSSSIKKIKNTDSLSCVKWLNRGMGNSTITNLTNYLSLSPALTKTNHVIIYAGENDIAFGNSVDTTLERMKSLTQQLIQSNSHDISIIKIKLSPARERFHDDFTEFNQQLEATFSNINNVRVLENNLDKFTATSYTSDGIHLTDKGYDLFTQGVSDICQDIAI
ncbi:hypothetical protein C9I98_01415 [Photobacterium sanctipauli]|uniref:SGNH hydrolase-type esterase domain-containing protein n=2 Tax=Photobacterium sanctipauli TaxID=1342794 RepID=A0A2T3P0B6_9GAMM|nr:GDSL-type esterase/lipase family protein [Photobacterium sanctipauli]PSW21950.1 hypothetical protein C9I98_01415 [Photobacterium sanctipauli]